MPQGQSEGTNLKQQPRLWDSYPSEKPQSKTLPCLLTEQRTEQSQPAAGQPIHCREQEGEGSQSQKGAIAAPERHPLPNCKQASLLTKTSWDSRQLTSSRRVAAGDQLLRRDTGHLRSHASSTPRKLSSWDGGGWGQLRSPNTWSPELLGPGKGTKHGPSQVCASVEDLRT